MGIDPTSGLGVPVNPHLTALDPVTEFTRLIKGDRDGRCESDALRIGGDYTPGYCRVRKAGEIVTWDKQKGYGYAGATLIFTGDDLSTFEVEFRMVTQTQVTEWKAFKKKYLTKRPASPQNSAFLPSQPRPQALGVFHPLLAEVGITQIVYEKILQFDQPKTGGEWIKVVEFSQYRAPKPLLGKPVGSTPAAAKTGPNAEDAAQLEMRSKLQTADALEQEIARKKKK